MYLESMKKHYEAAGTDAYDRNLVFNLDYQLHAAIEDMRQRARQLIEDADQLESAGADRLIESQMHLLTNMRFIQRLEEARALRDALGSYRAFRAGARRDLDTRNFVDPERPPNVTLFDLSSKEYDLFVEIANELDIEPNDVSERKVGRGRSVRVTMCLPDAVRLFNHMKQTYSYPLSADVKGLIENLDRTV
jgi:hypothetical protein